MGSSWLPHVLLGPWGQGAWVRPSRLRAAPVQPRHPPRAGSPMYILVPDPDAGQAAGPGVPRPFFLLAGHPLESGPRPPPSWPLHLPFPRRASEVRGRLSHEKPRRRQKPLREAAGVSGCLRRCSLARRPGLCPPLEGVQAECTQTSAWFASSPSCSSCAECGEPGGKALSQTALSLHFPNVSPQPLEELRGGSP